MWTNLVENSRALANIFDKELVSLSEIKLVDTIIEYGINLNLILRFDLNQYPKNPPKKWAINNSNTVQLVLRLVDSEIIFFKTIENCFYIGNLDITGDSDIKSIAFVEKESKDVIFIINAKWIYLDNITSYQSK